MEDRWLLYQVSWDSFFEKFDKWEGSFYCWFDPTADSLHLWNFIGFMVWVHLMRRWNKYIALTGWATGMIWDPGWKDAERAFLSEEDLKKNEMKIAAQISEIFMNLTQNLWESFKFWFVNNKDFFEWMSYLEFLRDVWKYITINNMIAKDTVKKRIEDPSKSISYTEFSYMLLQWYDYVRLFEDKWVTLQIWGQDQWWNLVTWTELIRKKLDWEAHVLTWSLITDASWKKFGKSEWNAIWLDKDKTSPYEIYQYFMNTTDEDIERYLKMLTLIEVEEIENIVKNHMKAPEKREGQKTLAYKVVEIIHWEKDANTSVVISDVIFWDKKIELIKSMDDDMLFELQKAMWWFKYSGESLFETIVNSWLENSNSNARNAIKSWAIFINEEKVSDFNLDLSDKFISDKVLLLRKWKKNFRIITK